MLSACLDWAIVAIPIAVGFIQWVTPIKKPNTHHRAVVFVSCVLFSVLIWLQQRVARQQHASELATLPTKEDIKKLPSVSDIVTEFRKEGGIAQSPWGMTDEQLTKLTERVSVYAPFTSDKPDLITAVLGNQDSVQFAQKLAAAFRNAHWKGVGGAGFGQAIFNGPVEGVIVVIRDKDDKPPGLSEFVSTVREAGIESVGQLDPTMPKDQFRIIVGSRPTR